MREGIVIGWDEWRAARAAKRTNLRRLGLDAPSRRMTDYGNAGRRLRKAFGGKRVPADLVARAEPEIAHARRGLWYNSFDWGNKISRWRCPFRIFGGGFGIMVGKTV